LGYTIDANLIGNGHQGRRRFAQSGQSFCLKVHSKTDRRIANLSNALLMIEFARVGPNLVYKY
tara:strand:- start:46041 stop:46229 length:189 start_codon:yes stop_codon:yes gene_type:complete